MISSSFVLSAAEDRRLITTPLKNTTPEERDRAIYAVETLGMSVVQAAEYAGISKSAVHRIKHQRLDAARHAAGELEFVEVAEYHCPKHGKTRISPCVACTAAAAQTTIRIAAQSQASDEETASEEAILEAA
jgi:Zn-dependent alcohol dehydrogenase